MTTISVRIDPELKKKMEKLNHLNWSEIIRQAIKEIVIYLQNLNLIQWERV